MKYTLLVAAAALLGATTVQAAEPMSPSASGAAPGAPGGAPMQNFGASPGLPGSSVSPSQPSYGAQPGAPGSPTYDPNAALPSLDNQGSTGAPNTGTSASGINTPSTS